MSVKIMTKHRVVVLGAGASRSVSYRVKTETPSPLDYDFFDLLQRQSARITLDRRGNAIVRVLDRMKRLPHEYWRTMERAFYTLHLRAYVAEKLGSSDVVGTDQAVIADFATCIQSLLRSAHGKHVCTNHQTLLQALEGQGTVLTLNYDLVAERALRKVCEEKDLKFGRWLYGLSLIRQPANQFCLLKLHGSSNWKYPTGDSSAVRFVVRTKSWSDFDNAPGYRGDTGEGTKFPIFLPFWDKRIEQGPWLSLWRKAYQRLETATDVVVWGYSLGETDIKASQLFSLTLGSKQQFNLCVIDPAAATRSRWRELFPNALYWEFSDIKDFLAQPPRWWTRAGTTAG